MRDLRCQQVFKNILSWLPSYKTLDTEFAPHGLRRTAASTASDLGFDIAKLIQLYRILKPLRIVLRVLPSLYIGHGSQSIG